MQTVRAWWLLVAFLSGMVLAMWAEELILNAHDNRLEFSTPVHFLSGQPSLMARLRNAAEVPFLIQTTLWSGNHNHVFRQATDRFVVSFDIWEESYRVVDLQAPGKRRDHLSAVDVEKWCVGQMGLDITGLSTSEPLWTLLDIRAEDPARDGGLFGKDKIGESGISLAPLLELFSRPARPEQLHWTWRRDSFTLDQLRRSGS